MKFVAKRALVTLSLFAGAFSGATAQDSPSMASFFDRVTVELMAKDYLPHTKPMTLTVDAQSEMPALVSLDSAYRYLVVAVCGAGCRNVDVGWSEIDAAPGIWLQRETRVGPTATLELSPQKKADYVLTFNTPGCERKACEFAFRVYYKPRPLF